MTATAQSVYEKPVYFPQTNSYFELVPVKHCELAAGVCVHWEEAVQLAAGRSHQGVRGRLAVVDSLDVHNFLRQTFHPATTAWIGLRYWCPVKRLQWANGQTHPFTGFQAWHPIWDHSDGAGCFDRSGVAKSSPPKFMPVAYSPVQNGFLWVAYGYEKFQNAYFVEYPLGDRRPEQAEANKAARQ